MNTAKITAAALILALAAGASASAGGKKDAAGKTPEIVYKVGIVGDTADIWKPVAEAVAAEGIRVELVEFSDYIQPNQALEDGDLDMNAFQHRAFLENANAQRGLHLVPIANTLIAPFGLYSKRITSLDALKPGDIIAIPNDPTNEGRALKILEQFGLIRLNPAKGWNVLPGDITENPKNLQFSELDAGQTYRALDDVAAAMINGGHAVRNGLNPERDSIVLETQEEGSDNPYINILAVREADKDNPVHRKIIAAYQTDAVKNVFATVYKGAYQPAW